MFTEKEFKDVTEFLGNLESWTPSSRLQAALAVVMHNDRRQYAVEKRGIRKKFIRSVAPTHRYLCEWEAMTESFLHENPNFQIRNWRLFLQ